MDKKDILRMAKDPRYISGIYNYCDRWCERCHFTSRCLNYAVGEEESDDPAGRDLNNKAFWDKLQSTFQQTSEMITEMAEEMGIDLNSLDVESAADDSRRRRAEAKDHELSQSAGEYSKIVDVWFASEQALFEQKEDDLNTVLKLGIGGATPQAEADSINDAVEVIRWYQHQIHVKLMRAVSHEDLVEEPDGDDALQSDSDGSAKVALIGMDRSVGAWGKLQEHFPDKTDSILDILLHLDRLRRRVEHFFPGARDFKRPGFDDS